ncbi:hypothetical protein DVH05_000042 [Phytophthora capsici]|nr:hypothetical protein DVH05_000042 [Phytophthora capsici]
MSETSKQQLEDKQGDDLTDVRYKLRVLIKFHDIIGDSMHMIRSKQIQRAARDVVAEEMEASQHLITCLWLIAKVTTEEPNEEEQSLYFLTEEYKALCNYLQAQNRRLQEHDETNSILVAFLFIVAVYLYFR